MTTWIDIEKEKPTEMEEYKVKVKSINTGYLNEFKALWVPKEEKFYSDQFPVSENSNIVCWKKIMEEYNVVHSYGQLGGISSIFGADSGEIL
jgi:hypothetical protein